MSRYPQRRDPRTGKTYYCHRAVAEWHLGRPLEPGEVVHHRDENMQDDNPDNLMVLPDQRAHMLVVTPTVPVLESIRDSPMF